MRAQRVVVGAAALALLATLGAGTAAAASTAVPAVVQSGPHQGPDNDNIQSGDQSGPDTPGEVEDGAGGADTDHIQQ